MNKLFLCPSCEKQVIVQEHHFGLQMRCPFCQQIFTTIQEPSSGTELDEIDANVYDWTTNVTGITHRNRRGMKRQLIASQCEVGEHIMFLFERGNPYDPYAIRVCRSNGEQLGYIPRNEAREMRLDGESGCRFDAYILQIMGGTVEKPNFGILLWIFQYESDDLSQIDQYIDQQLAEAEIIPLYRSSPIAIERNKPRFITIQRDEFGNLPPDVFSLDD